MVWFRACSFLLLAILTVVNQAGAAEFQIQQPLDKISAEHSTAAADTAASRSPICKPPSEWNLLDVPDHLHTAYSPDQPCHHEAWTKWLGLEGSHCGTGFFRP